MGLNPTHDNSFFFFIYNNYTCIYVCIFFSDRLFIRCQQKMMTQTGVWLLPFKELSMNCNTGECEKSFEISILVTCATRVITVYEIWAARIWNWKYYSLWVTLKENAKGCAYRLLCGVRQWPNSNKSVLDFGLTDLCLNPPSSDDIHMCENFEHFICYLTVIKQLVQRS